MRFGIISTQMDTLIPPGLSTEAVMANIAGYELTHVVKDLCGRGFNPIEVSADMALFLPHAFHAEAIEKLAALKEETGTPYTVHLPLWSAEVSTPLVPVRDGAVQAVVDAFELTLPLEPEMYVLHATGALAAEFYRMKVHELAKAFTLNEFQNQARHSLETILAKTGIPSRKLAIETVEFPFEMTLSLAEELDLSICFDTGHVLAGFSGAPDFFEALEACLPRLGEVHLHDSPWRSPDQEPGYHLDHKPLGQGDLDLGRFLDRLVEAGYEGPVVFELTVEEALESLEAIREVRPGMLG